MLNLSFKFLIEFMVAAVTMRTQNCPNMQAIPDSLTGQGRVGYRGLFTIYIDQFSEFFDPSLPIGRPFIY